MNYKLIAFDLDGTFLDDYKRVPEDNLTALRRASERGIYIVPASGRLYPYLPEEVRTLPGARYFITANGNGVYDAVEDRLLYTAAIELSDALRLADCLEGYGIPYDFYTDNKAYAQRDFWGLGDTYFTTPAMNRMFHTYIAKVRVPVDCLRSFIEEQTTPVQKMQLYFPDTDLSGKRKMLELLPPLFPQLVFSSSLPTNIEVNSAAATKGQALAVLCRELSIAPEETVVFGDGTNDMDMIALCPNSVAMINGDISVRAAARYISTVDNNSAGVARMLEQLGIV